MTDWDRPTDSADTTESYVHEYVTKPASEAVVDAVAAYTDRSPMEVPPLYDAVDPDALDALVGRSEARVRVRFEYGDREVTVTPDRVYLATEA